MLAHDLISLACSFASEWLEDDVDIVLSSELSNSSLRTANALSTTARIADIGRLIDDVIEEGSEDFSITLVEPVKTVLGSQSSATVFISVNDTEESVKKRGGAIDFWLILLGMLHLSRRVSLYREK